MIRPISFGETRFDALLADAQDHDGRLMARLRGNWLSGERRFELPGEMLMGTLSDGRLIAAGGVSLDPYTDEPDLGRIRHFYVVAAVHRQGERARLLQSLVDHGRKHFSRLRLLTNNPAAAAMYEAGGFAPSVAHKESHRLTF